jgi:hypothetical protein
MRTPWLPVLLHRHDVPDCVNKAPVNSPACRQRDRILPTPDRTAKTPPRTPMFEDLVVLLWKLLADLQVVLTLHFRAGVWPLIIRGLLRF